MENKVCLTAQVKSETKDRYRKVLRESGYKADMFLNIMIDLFEQTQEKEGKDNDK